jgi:hypothetical protein
VNINPGVEVGDLDAYVDHFEDPASCAPALLAPSDVGSARREPHAHHAAHDVRLVRTRDHVYSATGLAVVPLGGPVSGGTFWNSAVNVYE